MKLIIHADDFGMTKSVNHAIINLCKEGVMTSTSVMVNMPYYEEVTALRGLPVSLGLHAAFTEGMPVLSKDKIPSITDANGAFLSFNELHNRIKSNKVSTNDIFLEMEAQFLKLKKLLGEDLSFVDSHHGMQTKYKVFQEAFLKFGKTHKVHAIRTKRPIYITSGGAKNYLVKPQLVSIPKIGLKKWASAIYHSGLMKPYDDVFHTADGMILGKGNGIVDVLEKMVKMDKNDFPEGCYFIVSHPSVDEVGLENSNLRKVRVEEYNFLRSEKFKEFVKTKVELTNFSKL